MRRSRNSPVFQGLAAAPARATSAPSARTAVTATATWPASRSWLRPLARWKRSSGEVARRSSASSANVRPWSASSPCSRCCNRSPSWREAAAAAKRLRSLSNTGRLMPRTLRHRSISLCIVASCCRRVPWATSQVSATRAEPPAAASASQSKGPPGPDQGRGGPAGRSGGKEGLIGQRGELSLPGGQPPPCRAP